MYTTSIDGYDRTADLTARMAALGAVRHFQPSVYVTGKGYYHGEQQQYTLAEDTSYLIAVFGLKSDEEALYWCNRTVVTRLSPLMGLTDDLIASPPNLGSVYLLPDIADRLERQGYSRAITAKTLCLYSHYVATLSKEVDALPADNARLLYACADLVQLPYELSFEQRIDAARRHIAAGDLAALLAQGAPYTLIRDMFPIPTESGA